MKKQEEKQEHKEDVKHLEDKADVKLEGDKKEKAPKVKHEEKEVPTEQEILKAHREITEKAAKEVKPKNFDEAQLSASERAQQADTFPAHLAAYQAEQAADKKHTKKDDK